MRIVDIFTSVNKSDQLPISEAKAKEGWTDREHRVFERFLGYKSVCRHSEKSLPQILEETLAGLVRSQPILGRDMNYLVYCHSLHSVTRFETDLLKEIGGAILGCKPEYLSITQGACVSGFMGTELLNQLGNVNRDIRAVLLTGEKCFHKSVQYVEENGLFGEGATAVYFSNVRSEGGLAIAATSFQTLPGYWSRLEQPTLEMRNQYDRQFVQTITNTIREALATAGVSADQLVAIAPYHMSPPTADRIADALHVCRSKVIREHLYTSGHCFCGDVFLNLQHWLRLRSDTAAPQFVLAPSVGISGTFSAMILEWREASKC